MAARNLLLFVPVADEAFASALSKRMGWELKTPENILDEFKSSRPSNVSLTDEDIMAEVRAVRYGE